MNSGGNGKKGCETHAILEPLLAHLVKKQLDYCIEEVTSIGFRTDGDVKNYGVVFRAIKYLIDKYCDENGVYRAKNGREYNLNELLAYVCYFTSM